MMRPARRPMICALLLTLLAAPCGALRAWAGTDLRVYTGSAGQGRAPAAASPSKADVITRLKALQTQQQQILTNVDEQLKKLMKESTEVSLSAKDLSPVARKLNRLGDSLAALQDKRDEYVARRGFIDQMILLIDSKWTGQPLQEFLSGQLLEMAITEFGSADAGPRTSTFLVFLSIALREIPDPREDMVSFINDYMRFANVRDPKSPVDFLNSRSYTNGSMSLTARPADRSKLGDQVEARLRELGLDKNKNENPTTIKTRLPQPTPLQAAESATTAKGT